MNASEAYEKYKDVFARRNRNFIEPVLLDLWEAVKHEAFEKVAVVELKINGKVVYPDDRKIQG